jgi:hypothetical protein
LAGTQVRWEFEPSAFRIPEVLSADAPGVFAAVQVADIQASTAVGNMVGDVEKLTNTGD